jgi:Domain of unknown function (DUF4292)
MKNIIKIYSNLSYAFANEACKSIIPAWAGYGFSRVVGRAKILLLIVVFSACHRPNRKSKIATTTDSVAVIQAVVPPKINDSVIVTKPLSVETDDSKVLAVDVDFMYLKAKSKFSFKSKDQDIDDARVDIRMQKDKVIWFMVSKLGIEAARVLVRPDSIFIMDKIHSEYHTYDFITLSSQFNFNLSFGLIQSILIGNMPIPKLANQRFKREKDFFMLRQNEGKVMVENYIGEQNRRLNKLLVTEQPTKNSLRLDYEDFTALNNYLFPYTGLVQLDYQSQQDKQFYQTVFRIKHQKIDLLTEPISFPFSIPKSYTRK